MKTSASRIFFISAIVLIVPGIFLAGHYLNQAKETVFLPDYGMAPVFRFPWTQILISRKC